jgi:2-methylcitrate dehydratase
MTEVQDLAAFVDRASLDWLSGQALKQLKIRVLDTVGVAVGALSASPVEAVGALVKELGGRPLATLIGGGADSDPSRTVIPAHCGQ